MALWPASIILLDFRKCGLDQWRKRKHLIILSKDSSLELCKCERFIFKENLAFPRSRASSAAVRTHKVAGSSLQTDPLIFSVREALSSQTEPNRPAHCQVMSAQGYRVEGGLPLQGASEEPRQWGEDPTPPRCLLMSCPIRLQEDRRLGSASSYGCRPARQWGGEMERKSSRSGRHAHLEQTHCSRLN